MIADARDLAKLESDFHSGRNTRAYLPLCAAYRRERRFPEALDLCQKGLAQDPLSVAGRTMCARLLADLGRYEEALAEVAKGEQVDPLALGLLVEKARCQIRLQTKAEATETVVLLETHFPMEPQVKVLRSDLRALLAGGDRESRTVAIPQAMASARLEAVLPILHGQASAVGKVLAVGIVDLDSDKTVVEGAPDVVPLMEDYYGEVAQACVELDQGMARFCLMELKKALLLVYRRDRRLVLMALDPAINFGKLSHRMQSVLDAQLPILQHATEIEED